MLREKGIMILKTGEIKSTMHYTMLDNKLAIITTKTLKNLPEINKDNHVEILIGKNSYLAEANVIYDKNKITEVFNKMLAENNTYFTEFNDDLIAIEFLVNP